MTAISAPVLAITTFSIFSQVAESLPAALAFEAAATARDTFGGTVGVAAQLSDLTGAAVLAASGAAFVDGLHLAAVCGGVVVFGLAAVTVLWLGGERAGAPSKPEAEPEPSCACRADA